MTGTYFDERWLYRWTSLELHHASGMKSATRWRKDKIGDASLD